MYQLDEEMFSVFASSCSAMPEAKDCILSTKIMRRCNQNLRQTPWTQSLAPETLDSERAESTHEGSSVPQGAVCSVRD